MIIAPSPRPLHPGLAFRRGRRGVTAVLAMLFLIVFGALALGFYAAVTTASQVSSNDERVAHAYLAAESGMDFLRYQLAQVSIPPGTSPSNVMNELYGDLQTQLNSTPNFTGKPIARSGNTILIPGDASQKVNTSADGITGFRATITEASGQILVKMEGRYGDAGFGRAFTMNFTRADHPTTVFDFAVASKGKVLMQKGTIGGVTPSSTDTIATVMSGKKTSPAISVTGGTIGGDLSIVASGLASVTGGTVHGSSSPAYILANYTKVLKDAPDFPVADTSALKPYATSVYSGGSTLKNVRIPAGTNPKFTGGAVIQGILYIESPNTIDFRGHVQVQGMIVFEGVGTPATNVIDMRGNFSHGPLPTGSEFDSLRTIKGISVLAPTASMVISGSVDSVLNGNVILGKFNNGGSADWTIEQGTLLTLDETGDSTVFNGKTVKFKSTGSTNVPTKGLIYATYFRPDPVSYKEVSP
jgi:hypothetical protein